MKLLIDIGHPAHVHLFRNLALDLVAKGWEVLFSVRVKDENLKLIKGFHLNYVVTGVAKKNVFNKIITVFSRNRSLCKIFKSFQPSISISHSSFYLAQVSWFLKVPNITLEDTGNMEQILLYLPFTDVVITPASYHRSHGKSHIRYNGFHETAYLHPDFLTTKYEKSHTSPTKILIRLNDWSASHDIGHRGLSSKVLQRLIDLDSSSHQIKILSEKPLPTNLKHFALNIPADHLHEWLNNVILYIGEGASLASECALLGIPAIYVNSRSAGVIEAHVKAGLLYHFKNSDGVFEKATQLLSNTNTLDQHKFLAENYLKDKINLTRFLSWFIQDWPESMKIMKQNPDYQLNFK